MTIYTVFDSPDTTIWVDLAVSPRILGYVLLTIDTVEEPTLALTKADLIKLVAALTEVIEEF